MLLSALVALSLTFLPYAAAQTVSVSATASHPIPTSLWGQMYEDINHSGDGGLYAELLQNRAFQKVTPGTTASLNAWSAVNGASIAVIADPVPVSNALPNSLRVTIPRGVSGAVGVANSGYFGIKVNSSWTYQASFYYRFPTASNFVGNVTIGFRSTSGQVLGSTTARISGSQTRWAQVAVSLTPSVTAGNTNNIFTVTVDGAALAGQTINFAMFSLFPPTFKNRPNGMRIDIAETLAEMRPSFFRFPGGNNLEGQTVATRWQWNATLGPLVNRPGRQGDWSYINTDGLGLLEYLYWCEDVGMEPIMGVWAGYSLSGQVVREQDLGPYIQQAIDQINFVIGDPATSEAAALRASLGRPEPFRLQYVEIGNEDFFGANSYVYRWHAFVTALQRTFPDLHFIATTFVFNPILDPRPLYYDNHVYSNPDFFASNTHFYDGYQRNGTLYFEGEYAVTDGLEYPTMEASASEAAFMTGFERNADIVFAASYAPVLNHVQGSQWHPDLVSFDAANVYRSTSYYVQKLFSVNRGTEYLPSTLPDFQNGSAFWSVVRDANSGEIIIKVVNTVGSSSTITFVLPFANIDSTASVEVLSGARTARNTPQNPNAVVPRTSSLQIGRRFSYQAPAYSVSVLRFGAN